MTQAVKDTPKVAAQDDPQVLLAQAEQRLEQMLAQTEATHSR